MAITKERLEELIKEGATIYSNFGGISKIYLDYTDTYIKDDRLYEKYNRRFGDLFVGNLENLFETKEDAEFAFRYQNITRTETLSLPTWKEFCNGHKIHFYQKYIDYLCSINDNRIRLLECYGMGAKPLFDEPLTEENYLDACEICRKLFLSEEL